MIKIHKYYVNPDKVCAVYQDNDLIKIDLASGSVLTIRQNVVTLVEVLQALEKPKPPTARKQIKKE